MYIRIKQIEIQQFKNHLGMQYTGPSLKSLKMKLQLYNVFYKYFLYAYF